MPNKRQSLGCPGTVDDRGIGGWCPSEDILNTQRLLRRQLLDVDSTVSWPGARDLTALLLLSIDDPDMCWQTTLEFLQRNLHVERVDGGFATPGDLVYRPAAAEARSDPFEVPSLFGLEVDNRAAAAQQIWRAARPTVHPDMDQDVVFDASLRRYFLSIGTVAKMTAAISYRSSPIGLVCADKMHMGRGWRSKQYECFESVTREVMAPILYEARRLRACMTSVRQVPVTSSVGDRLQRLSEAELRVCRLVAEGLSYKEMAKHLHRSLSTVDHHLRNIRMKLGVKSTARLLSALSTTHW